MIEERTISAEGITADEVCANQIFGIDDSVGPSPSLAFTAFSILKPWLAALPTRDLLCGFGAVIRAFSACARAIHAAERAKWRELLSGMEYGILCDSYYVKDDFNVAFEGDTCRWSMDGNGYGGYYNVDSGGEGRWDVVRSSSSTFCLLDSGRPSVLNIPDDHDNPTIVPDPRVMALQLAVTDGDKTTNCCRYASPSLAHPPPDTTCNQISQLLAARNCPDAAASRNRELRAKTRSRAYPAPIVKMHPILHNAVLGTGDAQAPHCHPQPVCGVPANREANRKLQHSSLSVVSQLLSCGQDHFRLRVMHRVQPSRTSVLPDFASARCCMPEVR